MTSMAIAITAIPVAVMVKIVVTVAAEEIPVAGMVIVITEIPEAENLVDVELADLQVGAVQVTPVIADALPVVDADHPAVQVAGVIPVVHQQVQAVQVLALLPAEDLPAEAVHPEVNPVRGVHQEAENRLADLKAKQALLQEERATVK